MREIRFGIIGGGLMAREVAGAMARRGHLTGLDFRPRLVAVADIDGSRLSWFTENHPDVRLAVTDYRLLLESDDVEAVYCAVPHHLHEQIYGDVIAAGKHLLGEKPFGIDRRANGIILGCLREHPGVFARCSSEFPFFPGAYLLTRWIEQGRFGRIIDVDCGLWHSSDLDPTKPINWKRVVASNGEYGCLGDLGMHPLHIPLRYGWLPHDVRALLSKIVAERPGPDGVPVACETWDNAILACDVTTSDQRFPMLVSVKRIAPGEANTWFLRINGTACSAEYNTKYPKTIRSMTFRAGRPQGWEAVDVPNVSAYPAVTGSIFEFGFSDSILQMLTAYCDELLHGGDMRQPFRCATPQETELQHRVLTAALESGRTGRTIEV